MIIYKVENLENGRVYIGATTRELNLRKNEHKYDSLTRGVKYPLHEDIRLYGWDSFHFEMIDAAVSRAELNKKEAYWISFYKANENGNYNTASGYGSSGYKHSEETKVKMSIAKQDAHKGENNPNAKLTIEEVRHIKLLSLSGFPQRDIANVFDISVNNVSNIKAGKTWRHVKVEAV